MSKSIPVMQMTEINRPVAPKKKRRFSLRQIKDTLNRFRRSQLFMVVIILLIAGLPSYYFYHKSNLAEQRLKDPNTANQQVIDEVVKKVGRHILLPSGEQPTLATVSDVSKVKGQPFFTNAANGDKVLVYTQARKAILYRPDKDIIIEVAPLNIDSLQSNGATNQ